MDTRGQLALDFLFGITFFLIAFTFMIEFVPSLFITDSIDETGTAFTSYRTAAILTEDPGWWQNNIENGTDWENHLLSTARIGLAADINHKSRLTDTVNVISMNKSERFLMLDESEIITKLGMYNSIDNEIIRYNYNISIRKDGKPVLIGTVPFVIGDQYSDSTNIFKVKRMVLVETGSMATFSGNMLHSNGPANKTLISIDKENKGKVVIEMFNLTTTSAKANLDHVYVNGSALNSSSDYSVYRKSNSGYEKYSSPLTNDDTIRVEIQPGIIKSSSPIEIGFFDVTFTSGTSPRYSTLKEPYYEIAQMAVMIWK